MNDAVRDSVRDSVRDRLSTDFVSESRGALEVRELRWLPDEVFALMRLPPSLPPSLPPAEAAPLDFAPPPKIDATRTSSEGVSLRATAAACTRFFPLNFPVVRSRSRRRFCTSSNP